MQIPVMQVTENNKFVLDKPLDSSVIYFTEVLEWHTNNAFRSFSIKLPLNKTIEYKAGSKIYTVDTGNFLVAAKQPNVSAFGKSPDKISTICIDIAPETISEVSTIVSARDDFKFDHYLSKDFEYPHFFDAIYPLRGSVLGQKLQTLVPLVANPAEENKAISREMMLDMVEELVLLEKGNRMALNGLVSVKTSTRKETLTRLTVAMNYMNQYFLENPEVSLIATHCNMSEFHFFRCFRQAYGITPYQYMLKKRLNYSLELLAKKMPIQKIATSCGFPDTSTFSKAFRRTFGYAPSRIFSVHQ